MSEQLVKMPPKRQPLVQQVAQPEKGDEWQCWHYTPNPDGGMNEAWMEEYKATSESDARAKATKRLPHSRVAWCELKPEPMSEAIKKAPRQTKRFTSLFS